MPHRRYGRFTPEFRAEALRRVADSDKSIVRVAAEIGVDHRTLWCMPLGWAIDPDGQLTRTRASGS